MTTFTVPLMHLRCALSAVVQFVDSRREPDPRLSQVRLQPHGQYALALGSDRVSYGCAAIPVLDHDGEADPVDLTPTDIRKVLSVFPRPKLDEGQVFDEFTIEIRRNGNETTFTDNAGMFDGAHLTVPTFETKDFPEVAETIGAVATFTLAKASNTIAGTLTTATRDVGGADLWTQAPLMQRFTQAHRFYTVLVDAPLLITDTPGILGGGGAHVARIGGNFIGFARPVDVEGHDTEHAAAWARQWAARLNVPAVGETADHMPDPEEVDA